MSPIGTRGRVAVIRVVAALLGVGLGWSTWLAVAPAPALVPGAQPHAPALAERQPVAPAPVAPVPLHVVEGRLRPGDTLSAALHRHDIGSPVVHAVDRGMRPVFDFRYARPGDRFRASFDPDGLLVRFDYERSQLERYVLERAGEELRARRIEPEIRIRRGRIAGVVTDSLFEAIHDLGEATELASDFADIFAWDVDFSRGAQPGDEFSILYERRFLRTDDGTEVYIGPGRILAARYSNAQADYRAIAFSPAEGQEGYYRPDGSSVERQFLRAPLRYRRISSRYSLNRLHPILKVRRPHLGIDYAAPRGTPVWSVADGTVVFRGVQGGMGNLVKVRHANGFVTYYGHLSGFAPKLRVGAKVRQKQVIGYVGSTGLATGPHLDFRLRQNGRYLNPATLDTPPAQPIRADQMARFAQVRDSLLRELEPLSVLAVTSEAM